MRSHVSAVLHPAFSSRSAISGDTPLCAFKRSDRALRVDAKMLGCFPHGQAKRLQSGFADHFAGMGGVVHCHGSSFPAVSGSRSNQGRVTSSPSKAMTSRQLPDTETTQSLRLSVEPESRISGGDGRRHAEANANAKSRLTPTPRRPFAALGRGNPHHDQ